jgi:omega-6 fatty acid desaturase (delta-12 desaturase)
MGQHYRANTENGSLGFLQSMWTSVRMCHWVEPSEGAQGEGKGVFFFRNRNGLGVPPQKLAAPVAKPIAGTRAKMNVIVGSESDNE